MLASRRSYRETHREAVAARVNQASKWCLWHAQPLKAHAERPRRCEITIPKIARSSDEHGEGTGMFGVAHALRGCDHAMAAGSICLLEDGSERSQRDSVWGSV